jgi:small subunit ribosomal protein S6
MRERRRDYELMFIISPLKSSEEEITATINRVRQAITSAGGEVTSVDQTPPWGRRKFAYPIREYAEGEASRRAFTEGFYVLCHFSLPASQVPVVERALKLTDPVIRHLLTIIETRGQAVPAGAAVQVGASADANGLEEDDVDDLDEADDDLDDEDDDA